jgi:ribosomal protein S18 acetylase RimI-like enzyme
MPDTLATLELEYSVLLGWKPRLFKSKWDAGDDDVEPKYVERNPRTPYLWDMSEPILKGRTQPLEQLQEQFQERPDALSAEQIEEAFRAGEDMVNTDEMPPNASRPVKVDFLLKHDRIQFDAYHLLFETKSHLDLKLVHSAADLDEGELDACFKLVEKTSSADYKSSSIGWAPKKKKKEMSDPEMIYLLIHKVAGFGESKPGEDKSSICGFVSFMFTKDDPPHEDREVLYIYEIHLEDGLRGRGFGKKLIQFVEMASRECGIMKTMLTVFASNGGARALYERLGYTKDSCSPEAKTVRRRVIEPDYVIMSKELEG